MTNVIVNRIVYGTRYSQTQGTFFKTLAVNKGFLNELNLYTINILSFCRSIVLVLERAMSSKIPRGELV